MKSENLNRRSVIVATITAGSLILILGVTYRVLAAQLLTPVSTTPIDATALERFPMQIGDWTGEDIPLDETILDKICADAYVNRRYLRDNGEESISLFIAASGVTAGILVGHAPEDCNRSAGWTLTDHRSIELLLDHGTKLPYTILQFSRSGSLDEEKKTVLYYYMADEQFCGDRSQLRSRVRRGSNMVNCVAQVQIVASSRGILPADSAAKMVCDFAVDSAAAIAELFRQVERETPTNPSGALQEGGSR